MYKADCEVQLQFTVPATCYQSYFWHCIVLHYIGYCSGTVCVCRFCGSGSDSMLIHCLYSCLWMLVTCPDVTVMWLLGHFTHTVWYSVSTESVHARTSALWHSHTQYVTLHVIITEYTDTVIDILTACFMVQAVSRQPIILETQLQSHACTLGFVVEKVALRQVLYTSTSDPLSISFHLCSVHLFIYTTVM